MMKSQKPLFFLILAQYNYLAPFIIQYLNFPESVNALKHLFWFALICLSVMPIKLCAIEANFRADTVCFGNSTTLIYTTTDTVVPVIAHLWDFDNDGIFNDASGDTIIRSLNSPGNNLVGLKVIDSLLDSAVIYKNVFVAPLPDVMLDATDVCAGDTTRLENTTSILAGAISGYTWNFGDGQSFAGNQTMHLYTDTGTYTITLTAVSDLSCTSFSTTKAHIFPLPTVQIDLDGPDEFCFGDSARLSVDHEKSYILWSTGDVGAAITVKDSSGNYIATVVDSNTCVSKDSIDITVNPVPDLTISGPNSIPKGKAIELVASGADSYTWTPGEDLEDPAAATQLVAPLDSVTYQVTGSNSSGCTAIATIDIAVIDVLHVANLLTPNGDGENDFWYVENLGAVSNCPLKVFNRWGDLVFESNNYNNDWDGNLSGQPLPTGAYYYVFKCGSTGEIHKGTVNLLR